MSLLPEYEKVEREGRLLVGRSPRVRESNATKGALALMVGLPLLLAISGLLGAPWLLMLPAMAVAAAAGKWLLRRAETTDYSLRPENALLIDRNADQVTLDGRPLCAAHEISAVGVRSYQRQASDGGGPPDELVLVLGGGLGAPRQTLREDAIVVFKGSDMFLKGPAEWIAGYLGVPATEVRA